MKRGSHRSGTGVENGALNRDGIKRPLGSESIALMVLVIAASIFFSYALSLVTERKTGAVRRRSSRMLASAGRVLGFPHSSRTPSSLPDSRAIR